MNLLLEQLSSLIEDCEHELSILSNVSAFLNMNLPNISWVGFYLKKDNELILGPFQGKIACTNIAIGKGVCGACAKDKKTYLVENVHEFPGHIACDQASNSEIVVPIFIDSTLYGVLDIDSTSFSRFKETDQLFLEQVTAIIAQRLANVKYRI